MDNNSTALADAANLITSTETTALESIVAILKDASDKLDTLVSGLGYPTTYPADSVRIATNVKMNLQWPSQEAAQRLLALNPPAAPVAPTPTV